MMVNDSTPPGMFAHAHRGRTVEEIRPMHMALETKRWTRADLDHLPDDGNKYEVVRGELFVTPAPDPVHEQIIYVLAGELRRYADAQNVGEVHNGRFAVVLDDSQVEPDIVVRPSVGAPPPEWKDAPRPLLIVEVLSDSTTRRDRVAKRGLYLGGAIPEYWIVDGDKRTITVIRPDRPDEVVADKLTSTAPSALEPLELDVAAMFHKILG
jgi:Uma2 family endonuclease